MQEDVWTNTKTKAEYGVTGPLGSPRAWLRRALNAQNLDDTTFQPGSLTQHEISVAGIWYQKPDGYGLPITGMHRELFRWFDIPLAERMVRPRKLDLVPAVGLCAAVPMHEVMHWLKVYEAHGAAFTWWKRPSNQAMRAVGEGLKVRRQLDHHAVYKMLDEGLTSADISQKLNFPVQNIDYVVRKWRSGEQLKPRKPHLDKEAVLEACRAGVPVKQVAVQHSTSPAYIYRLLEDHK